MNLLFHFFIIFCFLTFTFALCPAGSIPSMSKNSTCFLFVAQKQRFLIAEESCNAQNGHLASIHDIFANMQIQGKPNQNYYMKNLNKKFLEHAQNNFTDSTTGDFWIGLSDLKSSGTWGWIDGSPLDFVDWDKGQPKSTPGYDCGGVSLQGGRWITDDCDKEKPYVCIISPVLTTTNPPFVECGYGRIYFEKTGYCYGEIAGNQTYTWAAGEIACQQAGAHLASIHSDEEYTFLDSMGFISWRWQWIGLYSNDDEHTWHWSDGTVFDYSHWATGYPKLNKSACVRMGAFVDDDCSALSYPICKKKP